MKTVEMFPCCMDCGGEWRELGHITEVVKVSYLNVRVVLDHVDMLQCSQCGVKEFVEFDGEDKALRSKAGDFLVNLARETGRFPVRFAQT